MARLVPVFEEVDGRQLFRGTFASVNAEGATLAVGHLEVDDLPGASITSPRFVATALVNQPVALPTGTVLP